MIGVGPIIIMCAKVEDHHHRPQPPYLAQSEASEAMEGSFETMLGAGDTISPDNATLLASG